MNIISGNIVFLMKFKTFLILCEMHLSWSERLVGWGQIFLHLFRDAHGEAFRAQLGNKIRMRLSKERIDCYMNFSMQ